jgi:hypothetical protein
MTYRALRSRPEMMPLMWLGETLNWAASSCRDACLEWASSLILRTSAFDSFATGLLSPEMPRPVRRG